MAETPMQLAARAWLARGYHPIPVERTEAKKPHTFKQGGWQNYRITDAQVPEFFPEQVHSEAAPHAFVFLNVGVLLGDEEGHADIDVDDPHALPLARAFAPPTGLIFGRPGKPRSHYFYICQPRTTCKQYKDPFDDAMLVELRCVWKKGTESQTVVPPSIHAKSGETLEFYADGEPGRIAGELLQGWVAQIAAGALLRKYYPAKGRNDTELALAGWLSGHMEIEDAVKFVLAIYPGTETSRVENSVRSTYANKTNGHEITGIPTLKECYGDAAAAVETAIAWLGYASDQDRALAARTNYESTLARFPWFADVTVNKNNEPVADMHTVCLLLENHPVLAGMMGWDDFKDRVLFLRDVPEIYVRKGKTINLDTDAANIAAFLQREGLPVSDLLMQRALLAVADRPAHHFHPAQDYLNKLLWDQVPRIDDWLTAYLDAAPARKQKPLRSPNAAPGAIMEISEPGETRDLETYLRAVGRCFLISAVARILKPGSKVDTALILESPEQGKNKSEAVRRLCPHPDWFAEDLPNVGDKDAKEQLLGKMIVELSELKSIRGLASEKVKTFMSLRVDTYRRPYGKGPIDRPRQVVFIGTTNEMEYLDDPSGGRRFWPVRVGNIGHAGWKALEADRDQLWAEAVVRYKAGEPWWLDDATEALARKEQKERQTTDVWADRILQWCENPTMPPGVESSAALLSTPRRVWTVEVIECVLRKGFETWTSGNMNSDSQRVSRILVAAGYIKSRRQRIKGRDINFYELKGATK
jgi:predicted P-loop ATPase